MSARATEKAKDDLISAILAWREAPHKSRSTVAAWDEVLAKVAGLIAAAKAVEPSAELAEVRANIARTAAVAEAAKPVEMAYPQGIQTIAGDHRMHFDALDRLRNLLAREIDLQQAVQS